MSDTSTTTGTPDTTEPEHEELEGSNVRPDAPDGEAPDRTDDVDETEEPEERGMGHALSADGAEFVARWEGCILRLYNDPTGNATIGVGHLVHMGRINGSEPAEFRHGITHERAIELLHIDAGKADAAVRKLITVPLNTHQRDALISFTFNVGAGNLGASTLRRKLNAGEYGAVPSELSKWTLSQGQRLPGLVRRREAEGNLFTHGRYR